MPRCLPSWSRISPHAAHSAAPGQVSRKHCSAPTAFSFLHQFQKSCHCICYSSSSRLHDLGKAKFIGRCDTDPQGAGKFGQALLFTAALLVFITSASFPSSDFSALFLCMGKLAGIAGVFGLSVTNPRQTSDQQETQEVWWWVSRRAGRDFSSPT